MKITFMKTKMILTTVLAVMIGAGALWFAPSSAAAADTASAAKKVLYYNCPMHPSVKEDKPGDCPICGMHLVPVYDNSANTNAPSVTATNSATAKTESTTMPCCGASCPMNSKP